MAEGLKVPVSVKIRLLDAEDLQPTFELVDAAIAAGASLVTLHGRTREMKGQYVGCADWAAIAAVRKHVAGRVPFVANGGIETAADVERCLAETECEGVMVSEGALENPALFTRVCPERRHRTLQMKCVKGF